MKYLLLSFGLLCAPVLAFAQATTPVAYEFLTLIESESRASSDAKLLFAPDFQGKGEIKLEELEGPAAMKNSAVYRRNVQVVNQQLALASAEGWELVSFSPSGGVSNNIETRYLLRRAKR